MNEQLKEEAMELFLQLSRMRRKLAERNECGHTHHARVRISRLNDLLKKVADRWRRRAGYANK